MAEHDTHDAHAAAGADAPRHERPEDWGWHHSFGRLGRISGVIFAIGLCLINVTTYYNTAQAPWLYGSVAIIVGLLLWDRHRRKNAWRNE